MFRKGVAVGTVIGSKSKSAFPVGRRLKTFEAAKRKTLRKISVGRPLYRKELNAKLAKRHELLKSNKSLEVGISMEREERKKRVADKEALIQKYRDLKFKFDESEFRRKVVEPSKLPGKFEREIVKLLSSQRDQLGKIENEISSKAGERKAGSKGKVRWLAAGRDARNKLRRIKALKAGQVS